MHNSFNRRTAIKIKDGHVQRKNNHLPTTHQGYVLDRESPGPGFRHLLTKRDLQAFIDLIPDWDRLSTRLEKIIFATRSPSADGEYVFYHREETSCIFLYPWPEDLWMEFRTSYFDAHLDTFEKIGLSYDRSDEDVLCRFTESQARAFMLLHVFLHELGHHHHRLRKKHRRSALDENYAERFALQRAEQMFLDYVRVFGDPRRS